MKRGLHTISEDLVGQLTGTQYSAEVKSYNYHLIKMRIAPTKLSAALRSVEKDALISTLCRGQH